MSIFKKSKQIKELQSQVNEVNQLYDNIRRALHNITSCTYGVIETEDSYIVYKSEKLVYRPMFIKQYLKLDDAEYANLKAHELLSYLQE